MQKAAAYRRANSKNARRSDCRERLAQQTERRRGVV